MKKFVFISILPVPYHVKYCSEIQKYFDAEFWFYTDKFIKHFSRPDWWKIELSDKCKILKNVFFTKYGKCLTLNILTELKRFDPDIIMIGGFVIPSNFIAYLWAKKHKKKVIVFVERSRTRKGVLKKYNTFRRILNYLYRNIDMVMVPSFDTISQYRDEFRLGNKVILGNYPIDLQKYFNHKIRKKKDSYTYLFPNRLVDLYNPVLAIEIFNEILKKFPNSKLLINSEGYLLKKCIEISENLNLTSNIEFLDNIKKWDELHLIYERADIMIFPALFSNGNLSIFEAMSSGMGIVISNKIMGNSGDFIVDGENGFKCNPDKFEFINKIENYINNPDLFEKHANINREKVKPFTIEETAKKTFNILKNYFKF